jgi:hypothetical protein
MNKYVYWYKLINMYIRYSIHTNDTQEEQNIVNKESLFNLINSIDTIDFLQDLFVRQQMIFPLIWHWQSIATVFE